MFTNSGAHGSAAAPLNRPKYPLAKRVGVVMATVLAVGLAAAPAHAADSLAGYKGDYTKLIPFLAQAASQTVNDVVVTATENTALQGLDSNTYLHQSMRKVSTTLTFAPGIAGFKAETSFHTDSPGGGFEDYLFNGYNASNQLVFTKNLRNVNGAFTFVPGTAAGEISDLITKLEIKYTFDSGAAENTRGSYLKLSLTDTYLSGSATARVPLEDVLGKVGTPITSTPALTPTGLAGTITYEITGGTLPAGLSFDPTTGVISGTPTAAASGVTIIIKGKGSTFGSASIPVRIYIGGGSTTPAAPKISVSPNSGPTAGGTSITISGAGFQPGAKVTVGGVACTNLVVVSATSITCKSPAGTAGAKDVVVTNPDGASVTAAGAFTYNAPEPTEPTDVTTTAQKPFKVAFNVYFDVVSTSLTKEARAAIKAAVDKVQSKAGANATISVRVTGWVQPAGISSNVQQLSRGRANAVVAELKRLGLDAKFVTFTPGEDSRNVATARRASTVISIK